MNKKWIQVIFYILLGVALLFSGIFSVGIDSGYILVRVSLEAIGEGLPTLAWGLASWIGGALVSERLKRGPGT